MRRVKNVTLDSRRTMKDYCILAELTSTMILELSDTDVHPYQSGFTRFAKQEERTVSTISLAPGKELLLSQRFDRQDLVSDTRKKIKSMGRMESTNHNLHLETHGHCFEKHLLSKGGSRQTVPCLLTMDIPHPGWSEATQRQQANKSLYCKNG